MNSFRCPARSILASLFKDAGQTLALVILLAVGSQTPDSLVSRFSWVLLALLALQLVSHPFSWYFTRFRFLPNGVERRSGVFTRSVRTMAWDAVTAVDVTQHWGQRLLGLHEVHLTQEGGSTGGITFAGVDAALLAEIQQRAGGVAVEQPATPVAVEEPSPDVPGGAAPTEPREEIVPIYRASVADLVVMALVRGQILLLGAGGLISLWEFVDDLPVLDGYLSVFDGVPVWGKVTAVLVAALAVGLVSTVVKFNDFHVRIVGGRLVTTYGLIERKDRRFDPAAVRGLVVHRNLVERILGRARLGVLTRDQDLETETNTVLPTLPIATVEAIAHEHFADITPSGSLVEPRSRVLASLGKLLLVSLPLVVTGVVMWLVRPSGWGIALALALAWAVPLLILGRFFTRFHVDEAKDIVVVRRDLVGEKTTTVRLGSVHAVGASHVAGRLVGAWFSTYTGSPERHWTLRATAEDVERVRRRLLAAERPTA